jgi:hypothetical protein
MKPANNALHAIREAAQPLAGAPDDYNRLFPRRFDRAIRRDPTF